MDKCSGWGAKATEGWHGQCRERRGLPYGGEVAGTRAGGKSGTARVAARARGHIDGGVGGAFLSHCSFEEWEESICEDRFWDWRRLLDDDMKIVIGLLTLTEEGFKDGGNRMRVKVARCAPSHIEIGTTIEFRT